MSAIVESLNFAGLWFVKFALPMLIQSSLLIVVILLLDRVVRKKVRAVVRYALWMLVLLKLVLPVTLAAPTGIGYWIGGSFLNPMFEASAQLPAQAEMQSTAQLPEASPATNHLGTTAQPGLGDLQNSSHDGDIDSLAGGALPAEQVAAVEAEFIGAMPVSKSVGLGWAAAVFLAWLTVVAGMILLIVQRSMFVAGLVRQGGEAGGELAAMLEECKRRLGVNAKKCVKLKLSSNATSPAVCGLFQPVILIPQNLPAKLSSRQLEAVLLHELAHVKRYDLWVNMAQALLQIFYFYNPLLWLANAIIRRLREQAVDEAVLVAMGKQASEYPETLLNVATLSLGRPALSLRLIGVVESQNALSLRIKHILSRPLPKSAKLGTLGLLILLLTAAVLLPMAQAEDEIVGINEILNTSDSRGQLTIKSIFMPPPEDTGILKQNHAQLSIEVENNSDEDLYLGLEYYQDSGSIGFFSPGSRNGAYIRKIPKKWTGRVDYQINYIRFVDSGNLQLKLAKCNIQESAYSEDNIVFLPPKDSEIIFEKKYIIVPDKESKNNSNNQKPQAEKPQAEEPKKTEAPAAEAEIEDKETPATQPSRPVGGEPRKFVGLLKARLGSFVLRVDEHKNVVTKTLLVFKNSRPKTQHLLRLSTSDIGLALPGDSSGDRQSPPFSSVKITQAQAVEVIDLLARRGIFGRGEELETHPGPNAPYYSLAVEAGPGVAFKMSMNKAEADVVLKALRGIPKGSRRAIQVADERLADSPIAKGWPLALPGSVRGTPVVADLDGDGDLEVVVPCMTGGYSYRQMPKLIHPEPNMERLVFAFHHDGTPVAGWPVAVMDLQTRLHYRQKRPRYSEDWASSPSVMDVDGDGRDELVILDRAGTVLIEHEKDGPIVKRLSGSGDGWGSVPLVDVNGDGVVDLIYGNVLMTVKGGEVAGWPKERIFKGGFVPCVADADGDGDLELFHPHYINSPRPGFANSIAGYDHTGKVLPGWPQQVGRHCLFPPVMGDVTGDGQMEIVGADQRGHIMAWTWEGRKFGGTETIGKYTSVFKDRVWASGASPTLADLDGDGAAEIIVFDRRTRSIRAWRGDGSGVLDPDDIIAYLPAAKVRGVTVGDLGGDGVMDLFAGTFWVKLRPDGTTKTINMLPEPEDSTTQCTITDVDGDGKADIVFGLTDGQVFIYETGLAYDKKWMQWPTSNGNFRHTGAWGKAKPTAKKKPAPPAKAKRPAPAKAPPDATVEGLALQMLAAIREKDDAKLKAMSVDRIEGWRDALPHFSMELRERFTQMTGKLFTMYPDESIVSGEVAAVKCIGPKELKGVYLVLFFVKTKTGWKNFLIRNSPPSISLETHLRKAAKDINARLADTPAAAPVAAKKSPLPAKKVKRPVLWRSKSVPSELAAGAKKPTPQLEKLSEKDAAAVLGLFLPVAVKKAGIHQDGGTIAIVLVDHMGREYSFCLDHRLEGLEERSTPKHIFIGDTYPTKPDAKKIPFNSRIERALITLLQAWADRQAGRKEQAEILNVVSVSELTDDGVKLQRVLHVIKYVNSRPAAAGGKLEFRIAPRRAAVDKAELALYMNWLGAGHVGFWPKTSRVSEAGGRMPTYGWLSVAAELANPELVTGEYKGQMYLLVSDKPDETMLQGKGKNAWGLTRAIATTDQFARPDVGFEFDSRGAKFFAALTKANVKNTLAIVVDGKVLSAPTIQAPLSNRAVITGKFSQPQAQALAKAIEAGTPAVAPPVKRPTFGPVIECVVNHTGENCLVDFDTGKLITPPKEASSGDNTKKVIKWTEAHGVDAGGGWPAASGIVGFDLIALPNSSGAWETMTPEKLSTYNDTVFKFCKPGNPVFLTAHGKMPVT